MPLLKKKPFKKLPLPDNLRNDEKIFHCEMTDEVFRDYEEYCHRVLLCNSMVWTCSMTGKLNLTYSEALESERNAKRILKDFPTELRIPILFLASKTQRTSFVDLVDDIFVYVKDRYFIGENVDALFIGNKWRESHVLQVIAPTESEIKNAKKNGHIADRHFYPPATLYRYEVEQLDAEDRDVSEVMIVDYDHIKRRKSCYSRDKNKLFLKQYVEQNEQGVIVIKQSTIESYGIDKMNFEQIFDGPLPNFIVSKKRNYKRARQQTLSNYFKKNGTKKNNGAHDSENSVNLLEKMKKRQEQYQQMRQKRADEKLAEKQKQKEENIKISTILKEWYKPKEDLELEDHKALPVPAPIQLKVPDKYVGDVLEIVEFVHSFSKLLYSTDFFPSGLTIELLERALIQQEVAGPLLDILQMFLTTLFHFQSEESKQYNIEIDNSDLKRKDLNDNVSLTEATNFATVASTWSVAYQGLPLRKLPLYSLTTSEILRLHLLSSGARINEVGAKSRYQLRGGYTSEDDPGLYLRLKQPHILKALALHNVTELSISDKLKILQCLMNQLLTYADVRDVVEDRLEKTKHAKLELKSVQTIERRREQEYVTARCRIKREARENNKDAVADLDNLSRMTERHKEDNDKKIEEFIKLTAENQTLLGHDRAFRKYYKLESVPGVFVNSEEENPGKCLDQCVKHNPELVGAGRPETLVHVRKLYDQLQLLEEKNGTNNDPYHVHLNSEKLIKLNGSNGSSESVVNPDALLTCSANPLKCVVHSSKIKQTWSFFHKPDQILELIDSLNQRGMREGDLRQTIINDQTHIESLISQTAGNRLNPMIPAEEDEEDQKPKAKKGRPKLNDTNLGYPPELNCPIVLQYALVENILEMEAKIYDGNLGSIKVKDRDTWRNYLTNHKYDLLDKTIIVRENGFKDDKVKKERNGLPITGDAPEEYNDPGRHLGSTLELESEDSDDDADLPLFHTDNEKLVIQSLAVTLIQVGQGVEARYLKRPLGNSALKKEKSMEFNVLDRWEHSLLAATSYSQIFLHYSTLDNCILWSRSALLARCQICRRPNDSENMLLCDNCNKGHHLYCLKPKLTSVPVGDWYCKECNKQKQKEAKLNNPEPPPPQKKRKIFKEELSDEESVKFEPLEHSDEEVEEDHKDEPMDEDDEDDDGLKNSTENHEKMNGKPPTMRVCIKCNTEETMLCCDKCSDSYHLECVEPPLHHVPRGKWFCVRCRSKRNSSYLDESYLYSRVAQRSGNMHNQRRCAARARHKIYGFIKTLRRMSESEDSDSSNEVIATRRSNRREIESRDDLPLHNAPLQELLSEVLKQECAWPFLRPVQKYEVPDYYEIITKPMDFGTIKYKLNMGNYKCDADLMVDAVLVFENCNTYNNAEDEVYKCGIKLLKYFTNKCRELGLKLPLELEAEDEDRVVLPELKKKRTL